MFFIFKDPNVRLIRELRAEIDRLKILLQAHGQVRNPGKKRIVLSKDVLNSFCKRLRNLFKDPLFSL